MEENKINTMEDVEKFGIIPTPLKQDACAIIEQAQHKAYQSVNMILIKRNWLLGLRITKELLKDGQRAEYGANIIESLSRYLQQCFGEGFDRSSLYKYIRFAEAYPTMFLADNKPLTNVDTLWTQLYAHPRRTAA
ncbi:MAG: DUF1016 N-terminal domain-containing protein [Paludibacteraceae bacterium]|nr:DUF1016 N-terminal domain-containing protein [Paludibacteraceae bacterium]